MIVGMSYIAQKHGCVIEAVDYDVDLAVVEEVAKGCAPCGNDVGQPASLHGRHHLEFLSMVDVVKEQWTFRPGCSPVVLIDLWVDVSAHEHEVFPAVVVVVEKLGAPTEKGIRRFGEAHLRSDVDEVSIAVIAI